MKFLLPLLLLASIVSITECKTVLNILGLIPFEERLTQLSSYKLTELAVHQINAREDILPGYHLQVQWNDTHCSGDYSLYQFFSNRGALDILVSVFGLPCIGSAIALTEVSPLYYPIIFTHSAYIPDHEHNGEYVINGFPTGINSVSAQLKFIYDHNWTRVATINYESFFFSDLGYELQRGFYQLNITNIVHSVTSTLSIHEYKTQVDDLVQSIDEEGFRVVVFNMFQEEAEYILCRMYTLGLDLDKYTIILPGFLHYSFGTTIHTHGCNLREIVTGTIGFIEHPRVDDILQMDFTTYNGDSVDEISHLIPNKDDSLEEVSGLYMYDSMWTLALALHETIYITGFDENFYETLYTNTLKQSFSSITGDVFFNRKLRVSQYAQVVEFTPTGTEFRGLYTNLPYDIDQIGNLTGVDLTNRVEFKYWDESRTDGVEDHESSYYIFYVIVVTSGLAFVYIIILISIVVFGLCKRFTPAVKSEPAMSIFILASNVIWLLLAVLLTIDGKFYPFRGNVIECTVYCHLLVWLGSICVSFILGGVLAKSLKLYSFRVLQRFGKNEKRIVNLHYLIPISLALIDTVIISIWAGFDPIEYAIKVVRSGERDPPFHKIAFCEFKVNIPLGVLLCIKVIVILFSIFLAYHLRKVTHKSQRYTFVISLMVYTTLFFSLFIIFIMGYVSFLDTKIGLAASFCVLAAICNASIIGLPIVYYMIRDPRGNNLFDPQACDLQACEYPEETKKLQKTISSLRKDIELMEFKNGKQNAKKKTSIAYTNFGATLES